VEQDRTADGQERSRWRNKTWGVVRKVALSDPLPPFGGSRLQEGSNIPMQSKIVKSDESYISKPKMDKRKVDCASYSSGVPHAEFLHKTSCPPQIPPW